MADKNGSPRQNATGGGSDAPIEQTRLRQSMNEKKPPVVSTTVPEDNSGTEGGPGSPNAPASSDAKARGLMDRSLQARLGRQLRAIFADVAEEPVPERFVKLLEALDAKEKRR